MYGDSWLDAAFAPIVDAFRASGMPALMTVYRNEGQWDTSNVVFRESRIACYDKREKRPDMAHIDYGLGVVSAATLAAQPDAFDLAALYTRLAAQGQLAGFEVFRRFYEIGTPAGLADTERHLKEAPMATPYTAAYYEEVVAVAKGIDQAQVDAIVEILAKMRKGPGRLFVLGVGGSAGNASHAVNDFRKICGIEAYAPTENTSTTSLALIRLPSSQLANTLFQPSSLVRAVSSETLSVGA